MISNKDLELLKKIGLRDFEERDLLIGLIEKIENNKNEHREYNKIKNREERKTNKFFGRSKKEIENYKRLHEKEN